MDPQYPPSTLRSIWQQILLEKTGVGESLDVCTEGFRWVTQDDGALTAMEAMIHLSFRIVDGGMTLYYLPQPEGEEKVVQLSPAEAAEVLEIVIRLAEFGVISAGYNSGTRSDFIARIDFAGELYVLPPATRPSPADKPLGDKHLFLSERLLNLIEAL